MYQLCPSLSVVMVALWNRAGRYIFALLFLLSSSFFSSPNLSGRRLDVCHTSTHGVALVRIQNAGLKLAARGSLKYRRQKLVYLYCSIKSSFAVYIVTFLPLVMNKVHHLVASAELSCSSLLVGWLVGWSLTSLFSTNTAIPETSSSLLMSFAVSLHKAKQLSNLHICKCVMYRYSTVSLDLGKIRHTLAT